MRRLTALVVFAAIAACAAAGFAQAPTWYALRTTDKFDNAKDPSTRLIAAVATIDRTKPVTFIVDAGNKKWNVTVSCSVVGWNDATKSFHVAPAVQQTDQAWQQWKERDPAAAFRNVNHGELWDPNADKATECCSTAEAEAGNIGGGCKERPNLVQACYAAVASTCVRYQNVELVTAADAKAQWEAPFREQISELAKQLAAVTERVRGLEDKKK